MASDYATWESKDGLKLRFHMKQMTDTAVTSQTDGDASLQRIGGPGEAHYTMPKDATVALPAGTLFPMAHTAAIIAAAREGKKFLALPLFDGTDENGAEDSSIAILDWKQPFATKWPLLSALPSTRVRLAFFDRKPDTIDAELRGRHALLGKRRGGRHADGFRRLRHERQDDRVRAATT